MSIRLPKLSGARRAVAVLTVIILGIGAASIFFTASQVGPIRTVTSKEQAQARALAAQVAKLRTAILATCASSADIGTAPVLPPGGAAPSRLAIQLVSDERAQWRQLGCPGALPVQPGPAALGRRLPYPVEVGGTA